MATTLYAEWQGEVGWLLMWYAPAIRHLSRSFDRTVFALDKSLAHIVEDFADEIVPLKCQGHAQHTGQILEGELPEIEDDWTVARWKDVFKTGWKKTPPEREYFEYGRPPKVLFDAICFFRPPKTLKGRGDPNRKSYVEDKAAKLVELLVAKGWRVGCAGGPDNRIYPGAVDIRNLPMDWLCSVLRGAGVAIGPSSGPMHLASLCGCPHVTWCDHSPIRKRYERTWNPFETTCAYLKEPNPEPETVAEAAERIRTR